MHQGTWTFQGGGGGDHSGRGRGRGGESKLGENNHDHSTRRTGQNGQVAEKCVNKM